MIQSTTSWIVIVVFVSLNAWLFSALTKKIDAYSTKVSAQRQAVIDELDS
jgi:hypothetical protein